MTRLRCAIYTRKSTEDGLEQDYNSLEAQRDACEAYIKSQASEGWATVKTRYDDGGLSGATMERPALHRLLADINTGKVDVVVVYKVDRLTRSLSDFAKMVDQFDQHQTSFVSVTQQFNTTTSMGRLTLNVLLSFAQFEREVTAERIRDKIAASKKKGLWMGGVVPLGYDVIDRKLIVNDTEAETVRTLFDLYCRLGTVDAVKEEADRLGLRTKARKPNNGNRGGNQPFRPGHLYKLFANRMYIGEIVHKGVGYPGEHQPMIDQDTWDKVQTRLSANARTRRYRTNMKSPCLLTGLLFDEEGDRLSPSYCIKQGRRYRYYITRDPGSRTGWRLPAKTLDAVVLDGICDFLSDKTLLMTDVVPSTSSAQEMADILSQAAELGITLRTTTPAEQRSFVQKTIDRIEVQQNRIRIDVGLSALRGRLGITDSDRNDVMPQSKTLKVDIPIALKRRGVETKLIIGGHSSPPSDPDPVLINAIRSAAKWFEELRNGSAASVGDLAKRHRIHQGDVSRILPIAFLAPDIVEAILNGQHPVELTAARLKRTRLPLDWAEQRRLLGFADR
jgi:site-specific DNA recombinase